MSNGDLRTPLALGTICGGQLEEEFQRMYPAILSQLKAGDKAKITINIELKRVPETNSMINLSYKIKPTFPDKTKASICQQTGDNKLHTEEPPEKIKVVNMFEEAGANEK